MDSYIDTLFNEKTLYIQIENKSATEEKQEETYAENPRNV